MRLLIAAMVFAVCCGYGLLKGSQLKKRCLLLRELSSMTAEISVRMGYLSPTTEELCSGCTGLFGELIREELAHYPDIRAAWRAAVDKLSNCSFMGQEEAELLYQLGQALGTSGREGQLSLLKLYEERFEALLKAAEDNLSAKGRLYKSVPPLIGLGLAIIVL